MAFTVEQLLDIKRTHESAMALSRSAPEALRQKIEERTVATVDTWSYSQYLTDFDRLTFGLNTAVPGISEKNFGSITETAQLLLSKVWPTSYPQLGQAFEWHRMVLTVLTNHIRDSMEGDARAEGRQRRTPRRDKRLERWDPVEHQRLFREFLVDCTVTWYLTTHLVKSANLVVRAVHSELDPLFRFEEGLYLMHTQEALSHRVIRLEYPVNYSPSGAVTGSLEDIRARVRALAGETSSKRADDIILEDIDGF
ncbi:hypothetical protein [Terrabacter sp. 2YAF2]|uniref:hypothetical protein n=1 Tax=Terrabacter sp. 2YAF2 TaxID=3233026 RepID=UPI003F9AAE8F